MIRHTARHFAHLILLAGLALGFFGGPAQAQQEPGVYQDHLKDAALTDKNPTRVRLVARDDLKLGRAGGVWGSVGNGDVGDSFFVGKTPDRVRLRVALSTLPGSPPVTLVFAGKDGANVTSQTIRSVAGEEVKQWISVKGDILFEVRPGSAGFAFYSVQIWYPGDTVDALTNDEINGISSGEYAERPSLFTARKED